MEQLDEGVKNISFKNFELFKLNPQHPSLHFKKVGMYWSIRVGLNHRALAIRDGGDFIWLWIGSHDKYEFMIK